MKPTHYLFILLMLFFFNIYQHFVINQFFVTLAIIFCVYMFTDLLKHLHFLLVIVFASSFSTY